MGQAPLLVSPLLNISTTNNGACSIAPQMHLPCSRGLPHAPNKTWNGIKTTIWNAPAVRAGKELLKINLIQIKTHEENYYLAWKKNSDLIKKDFPIY
jgi:hypothetical protein